MFLISLFHRKQQCVRGRSKGTDGKESPGFCNAPPAGHENTPQNRRKSGLPGYPDENNDYGVHTLTMPLFCFGLPQRRA